MSLRDCGKLFQGVGPATANERSPNLDVVLGTTNSSWKSNRNPVKLQVVAFQMQNSAMHDTANSCSDLYTRRQHLKVIL